MAGVENFNPEELGPHPGFSHASAHGALVILGGQTGVDASGRILAPGDLVAQFRQAIGNVGRALRAAGSAPENVLKLTYFVTDRDAYVAGAKEIGAAYRDVFGRHFPAMSLFEVTALYDREAMIEIECIAGREPASSA